MNLLQRTAIFAEWLERMSDLRGRDRIVARLAAAGDSAPVQDGSQGQGRMKYGQD